MPDLRENGDRTALAWHQDGTAMKENNRKMVPQWYQNRLSHFYCLFSRGFLQPHPLVPYKAATSPSPSPWLHSWYQWGAET